MKPAFGVFAIVLVLGGAVGCSSTDSLDGQGGSGSSGASSGSGSDTGSSGTGGNDTGTGKGSGGAQGTSSGSGAQAAAGASAAGRAGTGSGGSDGAGVGGGAGGAAAGTTAAGNGAAGSNATDPGECIVARRLDRCCAEYVAVTRSALAEDECLIEEPGPPADLTLGQSCAARSPVNCALVLCLPQVPPSRVVVASAAGGCSFVDECRSAADCVIASDARHCCACPVSMPAQLLQDDACLLPEGEPIPPAEICAPCKTPVQCGACAPPPATPTCLTDADALARCQ